MAKKARYEMSAAEMPGEMTPFRPEDVDEPVGGVCAPAQASLFATDPRARPLFADEAKVHGTRMQAKAMPGQRVVRVVELFSGLGGGSEGAARSIEGQGHLVQSRGVNHNPFACASFIAHAPDALVARWPVDGVSPTAIAPERHVDLLVAGPSCCPFSTNANGMALDPEERALCWSILPMLRAPLVTDYFLIENVPEFRTLGPLYPPDYPIVALRNRPIPEHAGEEFAAFLGALRVGYQVACRVEDAADYGVPQNRKRLIIVGARYGLPLRLPRRTHAAPDVAEQLELQPWLTAESFIDWSDRGEPIASKSGISEDYTMQVVARALGDGQTRFLVPRKQGKNRFYRRVDRPLMTVTASAPGHGVCSVHDGVVYHRSLRDDELLAAQGFRRDRPLIAPRREERLRLIGNAMPPAMIHAHVDALLFGVNAEDAAPPACPAAAALTLAA